MASLFKCLSWYHDWYYNQCSSCNLQRVVSIEIWKMVCGIFNDRIVCINDVYQFNQRFVDGC